MLYSPSLSSRTTVTLAELELFWMAYSNNFNIIRLTQRQLRIFQVPILLVAYLTVQIKTKLKTKKTNRAIQADVNTNLIYTNGTWRKVSHRMLPGRRRQNKMIKCCLAR